MQHTLTRRLTFTLLALNLSLALMSAEGFQPARARQLSDEAAIRELLGRYFDAYGRKELSEMFGLWSAQSPSLEAYRSAMRDFMKSRGPFEVSNLSIGKVNIEGNKAQARVSFYFSYWAKRVGEARKIENGRLNRIFHLVKEDGGWKIWKTETPDSELAASLVGAKTAEERTALLEKEKELVTTDLPASIMKLCGGESNKGNYQGAIDCYALARQVAERLNDRLAVADALSGAGASYRAQKKSELALEQYRQCLALLEALEEKGVRTGRILYRIGTIYSDEGDLEHALLYYQKSAALLEAVEDKAGLAHSYLGIASTYFKQGRADQKQELITSAIEHYQKALKNAEEAGDKRLAADLLSRIAQIYSSIGDNRQSIDYQQLALKKSEEAGDKLKAANACYYIASAYLHLGDNQIALEYWEKARRLYESLGNQAEVARLLNSIGQTYRIEGHYRMALEAATKALEISESLGRKQEAAAALATMGVIYSDQGNYEPALDYYRKAQLLYEETGDKFGLSELLQGVGWVMQVKGDYAQALEVYQKSLKLAEEVSTKGIIGSTSNTLTNIGIVYGLQQKWSEAESYLRKSLSVREARGDQVGISETLKELGRIYGAQGDYKRAVEYGERSSDIARRMACGYLLWDALTVTGKAYKALDQPARARQAFEEAIGTIEAMRAEVAGGEVEQQQFLENKLAPYQQMVDLLVAQNNLTEALVYAERTKGRVLSDVLQNGRVNITKAMTAQEQEQESRLRGDITSLNEQLLGASVGTKPDANRIAELKSRLQQARLNFEAFQSRLYAAHPQLRARRGEALPIKLEQAAELLPDANTALLEYLVTEQKTYLFVLTKNERQEKVELKVYRVEAKREEIDKRAESYRRLLAGRDPDFAAPARQLYELLLRPAERQLAGKTRLVIMPDASLWNLPFHALQSADARYVLDDYVVSYAPSLTVLREMTSLRRNAESRDARTATLLALGNPAVGSRTVERARQTMRDEKLEPLPEAEKEVRELAKLYGAQQSRVYVGAEAREDRLKDEADRYRVIHLATHGMLNDSSPMYSYLVLSQSATNGAEDGLLEAWEIMNLNLKADLVVLSACDTARGRIGAGEGVIGLTWAFFVAGAPTTVVSQWKVESLSTAELMTGFHQSLIAELKSRKSRISEAGALRQAVVKLRQDERFRHPFYWAGFVVVGADS